MPWRRQKVGGHQHRKTAELRVYASAEKVVKPLGFLNLNFLNQGFLNWQWCSLVNAFLTVVIPSRFIGEESASASKTADSSRDTAALRNDNFE